MRVKSWLILAGLGCLLAIGPKQGLSQYPGRGDSSRGGDRGDRSSGGGYDPNRFFDMMAKGKDFISINDVDPRFRDRMTQFAQQQGITNGVITRDQFQAYMQMRMSGQLGPPPGSSSGRGPGSFTPPSSGQPNTPMTPPRPPMDLDAEAAQRFQWQDRNQDGVLDAGEMSNTLRAELSIWDHNHDNFIDLNEYRDYYRALKQKEMSGGDPYQQWGGYGQGYGPGPMDQPLPVDDKKPTVFRADSLPKELPSWFKELDGNKDLMVGLYEWKGRGWSDEEFAKYDRNNDGFVTIEEALRGPNASQAAVASNDRGRGDRSSGGPPSMGRGGDRSSSGGPPSMGRGDRSSSGGPPSSGRGDRSSESGSGEKKGSYDSRKKEYPKPGESGKK